MVFSDTNGNDSDPWADLGKELEFEYDLVNRELQEISLMLEQSQLEVNKLAQRNALVTAQLQQIQGHFDSAPRNDIRTTYNEALDAQQRLFVMRGQSEKLLSDKKHLERYQTYLKKVTDILQGSDTTPQANYKSSEMFGTVEAIIQAQEAERQRLSRQMHDGPAQALSNFILQTEIAVRLFDMDQDKAREELNNLKDSATSSFQKVRDFVFELRPMMLDDLGIVPTLKRYVEAFKEQNDVNVRLSVTGVERRLESYIEVIIFRAIQEILGFAVRQNQANQITVHMDITDTHLKITIDDDGKSIDIESVLDGSGVGIKIIKERVEMLGGYLDIDSQSGKGSQIVFQVPAGTSGQSVFA
jgi:two-component system, NarL family, sensor histidine kinase DegS